VGIVIFLLAAVAACCLFVQWWVNRPDSSNELPPLVIPLAVTPEEEVPAWRPAPRPAPEPMAPPAPPDLAAVWGPPSTSTRSSQTPLKVVRDVVSFDEPSPSETVRFRRPVDEPVQLLPGRLEVVSGDPRHQEIRFVRIPGRPAELILGRDPGDSAQHVTLRSSTVSRQHARLAFANGRWAVSNLSLTNPVVLNDEELSARDGDRDLTDGDRLELGEVVLRFHAH
jgi:hypothetical protein